MGDTGPCGPCSEIHYLPGRQPPLRRGRTRAATCLGVECECDRWLEIWNLVFMQFNRDAVGPARAAARALRRHRHGPGARHRRRAGQAHRTTTPTSSSRSSRRSARARARPTAPTRADDVSLRVIADHLRATTFLIADGVMPGNEGRGYVLRKIMRRAMRHGKKLGHRGQPFLHELTARGGGAHGRRLSRAARARRASVARVVRAEEERFGSTLQAGARASSSRSRRSCARARGRHRRAPTPSSSTTPTACPSTSLEELAQDRGLRVDQRRLRARARRPSSERARQSSKMGAVTGDPVYLGLLEQTARRSSSATSRLVVEDARVLAVAQGRRAREAPRRGRRGRDRPRPHAVLRRSRAARSATTASSRPTGAAAEVLDATLPVPGPLPAPREGDRRRVRGRA